MKYIIFILFLGLYVFLDNLGFQNYGMLIGAFGWGLFLIVMTLNILIAYVSTITINNIVLSKVGTTVGVSIGNIIGAVFAGCTSCGISLLTIIGINIALPFATPGAIEFKILALVIVTAGYLYTNYRIKKGCKIA